MTVLIAGGGISGICLALSCHQVGIPFKVFESVKVLKPLGVGINLQPQAVRELYDLGLAEKLETVGVRTKDYGMYTDKGAHAWTEPRGCDAGYKWPQYSVHRGYLHIMLYRELLARAGPDCIETGWAVTGFANDVDTALLYLKNGDNEVRAVHGSVAIGADGIHSAVRKQMVPEEGGPAWGGAVLWRGTTRAVPFLTGASMVLIGRKGQRFVSYPISRPDPTTGLATINWIANLEYDPGDDWNREDWNRKASLDDFLHRFEGFKFSWLDAGELIRNSGAVFEYPMVDRDPLERWTHGRVSLMGDAAHAAYPVGSNGAGAGIIDARKLVSYFLAYGLTEAALQAYEAEMRPITEKMVLTNRVAGPDKILDIVGERCDGEFDDINDVMSDEEMLQHSITYKKIAGFGIEETNAAPRTIPEGACYQPAGQFED